jgi:hypothetical protein
MYTGYIVYWVLTRVAHQRSIALSTKLYVYWVYSILGVDKGGAPEVYCLVNKALCILGI